VQFVNFVSGAAPEGGTFSKNGIKKEVINAGIR
jgi:hypothetical protein